MMCMRCRGLGRVDCVIFSGQKACPQCGGTGQQPPPPSYKDFRDAFRDAADEWMDRQEHDWTPDYEAGDWVPAGAAERWASPDGPWREWDGWQ